MTQPTARTQIRRAPKRGSYDRQTIHQILDEGLVCHVGFISAGHPVVIPTAYGRKDEQLYIHGSPASRMLRSLQGDLEICVTVTLLDGLVLARSAFHHSMNYRSVVIFGSATVVGDRAEKAQALEALTNHVLPKRWSEVRLPTQQELDGTMVLSLPLTEASAKIRTGPPIDDEADYQLPVWAGELPFKQTISRPIPDPQLEDGTSLSTSIQHYVQRCMSEG